MTSNIKQFTAQVGRFADEDVPQRVQQVQQKIGLQALRGVVNKTPVDTGRARGNWQTTLGDPATGTLDTTDQGGNQTIARGSSTVTTAEPFSVIWLSNNLPYIERLENGYSQQAPNGMVSTTVTEIRTQFGRIE
jgi:hypothetical protein